MFKKLFGTKTTVESVPTEQAPTTGDKSPQSQKNNAEAADGRNSGAAHKSRASSSKRARSTKPTSSRETGGKSRTQPSSGPTRNSNRPASDRISREKAKQQKNLEAHKQWRLESFAVAPREGETRFHDLQLPSPLMHAIADLGFEYCSPIQAQVLPHTLEGCDAVGKAQTGTGKTAAFLLAAMNEILLNPIEGERFLAEPRVVVLAPTRELVLQIGADAKDLGKYTGLGIETLVGGMDFQKQLDALNDHVVDIVAATPGRLIDFITRGHINLGLTEVLVLDEADRMLDMGFIPQVRRIVRATPPRESRQTMLFSATFNYDVNIMIESWMVDPVRIEIEPENIAADTVDQKVYMVGSDEKYQVLKNIVQSEGISSTIVFANRRDQTRDLYAALRKDGINCGMLSGEIAQQKRTRTLQQFKNGQIKVLVATDVAGRGIHIDDISHVVNYNLPEDPEDYVHRIGRTGRAGASGISISLACEDDAFMLPEIEALLGRKLECTQPPAELLD